MEFVSFDLETTGTLSHRDHIVEIGAVRFIDGKPKESYQQLICIDIEMPKQASQINGITNAMLEGQPSIDKVLPDFSRFCSESLMVAHNASFDFQFLKRVIEDFKTPAPKGLVLDTCLLARNSFPGLANYKLSTLCHYLHIQTNKFHRAKADALYCGELFIRILKKHLLFKQNTTEEDIVKLSERKPLKFPDFNSMGQISLF